MIDVHALIAKQKAQLATPTSNQVPIALGGEIVTLEVTRLETARWLALKAEHPPRATVPLDSNIGFNAYSLTKATLPEYTTIVDGDERQPLDPKLWAEMWAVLDGPDIELLASVVWGLNVFQPNKTKVALLGKAQKASSKKKRS